MPTCVYIVGCLVARRDGFANTANAIQVVIGLALLSRRTRDAKELLSRATIQGGIPVLIG